MNKASSKNIWYYNSDLRQYANINRKEMTKAEACLWKYVLSKRQMEGYQFRRQRPVLYYITDFMCKELMLIIEVDGLSHQWEDVMLNDIKRQKALEKIGFSVLRFDDDEVLNNINGVYGKILEYIESYRIKNAP